MPPDVQSLIKISIASVIGIIMLVIVASMLLGGAAEVRPVTDDSVTIDSGLSDVPRSVTVRATKGNALAFDGGGYVDSPALSGGSVSVCASATLVDDANADATYTLFGARDGAVLLEYDAGAWMFYAENGTSGDDAKATLPAPDPTTWRQVCGRYNATAGTVSVSRDDTVSAPVALDSATTTRNVSLNWRGSIDEVRTSGDAVGNGTLSMYGDQPIRPWPNVDRTGRMMFDEGSGSTTEVYWSSADATIYNGNWTDGLSDPGLQRGTDYELVDAPFALYVAAGDYLAGAPIVYISWMALPMGVNVVGIIVSAIGLVVLAFAGRAVLEVWNS